MFPSAKYAYQTVGCHFIVEMFVFVYDIKYLLMIMLIRFKQIVATNNFKITVEHPHSFKVVCFRKKFKMGFLPTVHHI